MDESKTKAIPHVLRVLIGFLIALAIYLFMKGVM